MSKPRKKTKNTAEEQAGEQAEPVVESNADEEPDTAAVSETGAEASAGPAAEREAEQDPLETLRAERDAFEEKWLRAVAEMDNVRKRARRDLQDSRRFALAEILRPLLEVQDNFERALQSLPDGEDTGSGAGIREGIDLIFEKFRSVLRETGVEPIPALDREFDPKVHEAVGQAPREGVEAGTVIEVVQPGFLLGGEFVLRPARVIVAG